MTTISSHITVHHNQLPNIASLCWLWLASCRKTRNAITGGIIMVAGCAVGYKTKFQHAIALSSTEAAGGSLQNWEDGLILLFTSWRPGTTTAKCHNLIQR
jgi:hypothetical protein